MRVTTTAPDWARPLVEQVCADYKRALPEKLQWYNTKEKHTSGHTRYSGKIHVSAGTDSWEHLPVLLHELAHWIIGRTPKGRRAGHNLAFWQLVAQLNAKHGDLGLAFKREVSLATEWRPGTRKTAVAVFAERGYRDEN